MSDYYNTAGNQIQPDFAGNFFRGQQQGMQRQQFQQQQDSQNQLRNLLPQAIATDDPNQQRNLLGQIAAVDPASAGMATGILDKLSDQQKQAVSQKAEAMVRTLVGVHSIQDPAQKAQAWTQLKQQAIASGVQGAAQLSDDPEQGIAQAYAHVAPLAEIGKELNFGQSDKEKWTPVNVPQSDGSFRLMMTDGQNNWKAPDFGGGQPVPQAQSPVIGQVGAPNPAVAGQAMGTNAVSGYGPPGFGKSGMPVGPTDPQTAAATVADMERTQGQPFAPFVRQKMIADIAAGRQVSLGGGAGSAPAAPQTTQQPASYASAATPSTAPQPAYASAGLYPGGTPQMGVKPAEGQKPEAGYRWADAAHTRYEPIPGGPADKSAQAASLGDPSLQGDAYLQSVQDPGMRSLVKSIAEGRTQVPRIYRSAKAGEIGATQIAEAVAQFDPSFNAQDFNSRNRTRIEFTSGATGKQINAINTAIGHLESYVNDFQKLDNFHSGIGSQPLNAILNAGRDFNNDPRLNPVRTDISAIAGELTRVYRQAGGTESDIAAWKAGLGTSNSPESAMASIKAMATLLQSKLSAMQQQYSLGMGSADAPLPILNAHSIDALSKITGENVMPMYAGGNQRMQPAKNGPTVGDVEQGYRFKGGNPADQNAWEKVQ